MKLNRNSKLRILMLCALAAGLLAGCGVSDEAPRDTAGAAPGAATAIGMDVCANCHLGMVGDWLQTPHANLNPANPSNLNYTGNPTLAQITPTPPTCSKNCHDPNTESANYIVGVTGNVPRPMVGCEACHGPGSNHNGTGPIGPYAQAAGTIGTTPVSSVSAQFNTCTNCHELLDLTAADPPNAGSATTAAHDAGGSDSGALVSTGASITDTHYATPGVYTGPNSANTVPITGYAMNYNKDTVCSDCHSPHRNLNINREWAQSAHGGDWTAAGAWAHYNWSASNRVTCQRCKSATGFSAYADALRTNNAALAATIRDGSTPPLTANANYKPELLHCTGCHTDNRGTLRNPGKITGYYDIVISGVTYSQFSYQFSDIMESNICMACHTGRETGNSIKLLNEQGLTAMNFSNIGFGNVNSHYLTAGATVFRVSGYEYPGRNYDDLTGYRHKNIGLPAEPGTGSRGPCIGCHMSRPAGNGDHLFLPVSRDALGVVTGIASEVCMVCHGPSPTVIFDLVSHQESLYTEALEALKAQLAYANAFHPSWVWQSSHPYFLNTNWLSTGDIDTTGNTTGKHNIGAAFNFNLLEHEGGGYVHNRMYVKRLIYDSIDWLDDNQMNYSVGATLDAAPHLGSLWETEAKEYLLPNGKLTGLAAERP